MVLVGRQITVVEVEPERWSASVLAGLFRGLDPQRGSLTDHVGLQLGDRAHDIEKGALVWIVVTELPGRDSYRGYAGR